MNEHSEGPETFNIQQWLSEVVRRDLLQTGAMQAVEEKMREVSARSAQMTESADCHSEGEGAA